MKNEFVMRSIYAAVIVAILLSIPTSLVSQGMGGSREPRLEDVATIDGIVRAFYEVISGPCGQERDWGRDSTLYLRDLRFTIVERRSGKVVLSTVDHHTYVVESDSILRQGFFEREIHRTVERFGPIAHVFSTYEWRTSENGPVRCKGINSMELVYDDRRWWIASVLWTTENERDKIPQEYLPKD